MNKPDKIFVGPQPERLPDGGALFHSGDAYLLATPERELASELVEALRGLTEHTESTEEWMESNGYDGGPDREAVKYSRAVLAKLDKGE